MPEFFRVQQLESPSPTTVIELLLPDAIDRWTPRKLRALGTDGFGRSEDRAGLRDFFEVDARFITVATLSELMTEGQIEAKVVAQAIKDLGINPDKPNPAIA